MSSEEIGKQVGRNIAEARRRVGLSQMQLTKLIPLGQQEISRLENGRSCPRLKTLLTLARALDVPVADLVQGIE